MSTMPTDDNQLLSKALKVIMANSDEYAFVKDKDLVYHAASETFARMCGQKSEADVIGKTDYDLFPKDIADSYREDDKKLFALQKDLNGYIEKLPGEKGQVRWSKTWKQLVGMSRNKSLVYMVGAGILPKK